MKLYELKEHREALGYQIERIADLMKVRLSTIETIESADESQPLSAHEIFCIRRYCSILNVDFNTIELSPQANPDVHPAVDLHPTRPRTTLKKVIIIFPLILAATYYFYNKPATEHHQPTSNIIISNISPTPTDGTSYD